MSAVQTLGATQRPLGGVPLLVACTFGVSAQTVASYVLGQFMQPLEHAFGWSRTETSAGLALMGAMAFLLSPVVGRAVDRGDARRLVLFGIVLSGLAFSSFSLSSGDIRLWLATWTVLGVGLVLISPIIWVPVAADAFAARRNLAIVITLAGVSIAGTFGPVISRWLVGAYGWRAAFQLIGLFWFGGAFLLALLFFFDQRPRGQVAPRAPAPSAREPAAQDLRRIFLSVTFLKLFGAIFVAIILLSAYAIHLAPSLVKGGLSPMQAARIASAYGVASLAGKLSTGWVFDRAPTWVISTGSMALLAAGAVLLAVGAGDPPVALAATICTGVSGGALYVIMPCITRRLYPVEHFGVVDGALTSALALAAGIAPLLAGVLYDAFGSYNPGFWAGVPLALGSALVLGTLKTGPEPSEMQA